MRKVRVGIRVERVMKAMREGAVLVRAVSPLLDGNDVWWLEPINKTVGPVTARKVLNRFDVSGNGDGLFGMSQTYRYIDRRK